MPCNKKCPKCEETISKRDVFNTGYKRECQVITCHKCNSKLTANWGRIGGYLGLGILMVSPILSLFNSSTPLGIFIAVITVLFVLFPLIMVAGICLVPLEIKNE